MEDTILSRIKEEHDEIEHLMEEILIHQEKNERAEFFKMIKEELVSHMDSEDETIYQRLRNEISDERVLKISAQSEKEHFVIKEYLQRLNLMEIDSEEWLNEFRKFSSFLHKHCMEEEIELFAEAKEDYSREELIEIGNEFEEVKHHKS